MPGPLSYPFTAAHDRPTDELTSLLGGKGAGLAAMTAAGLPVPPGFTLTTEACRVYLAAGWQEEFDREVDAGLDELERVTGKALGSADRPLLVSVRSGAEVSMPGMMDTVLNVGMNADVERGLTAVTGDAAFAADTHRRALLYYGAIVGGASEALLAEAEARTTPAEVAAVLADGGVVVPAEPREQVRRAVRVVFDSWGSERAVRYREIEGIDSGLGTAATVQAMVFGNWGEQSGTGVAFSRDPATGAPGLMGDFLVRAQGEDVVAGTHATGSLADMAARWPDRYAELEGIAATLERHLRDMVDLEFTVEQGSLWMLQTRRGKRSPLAAFRVALDLAEDPDFPVDRAEAVERCRPYLDNPPTVDAVPADGADGGSELPVIATGLGASPGRASGVLCLDPGEAVELEAAGSDVILARRETSPSDVHGMAASKGIFTTLGGQVSHAAVVARSWGLPAVVGAGEAQIVDGAVVGPGGRVEAGTTVTVDGINGRLLLGGSSVATTTPPEVTTILAWAGELDPTGAATAEDAVPSTATEAAGEGVGVGDLAFAVNHALRIKGMVATPILAAMCGTTTEAVTPHLEAMVAAEEATYMEPRELWVLTPAGREAHAPRLVAAAAGLDLGALPYQDFLALNDDFKRLCTDWQLRDGQPNDHTDAAYDEAIRARLVELDGRAQPIVAGVAAVIPWTTPYGGRLAAAKDRIVSGDPKALTGVMCDSYHDIWMELHEDLILTQGIDRAAEGSA